MAQHTVTVSWNKATPDFAKGRYSREHTWLFDGGLSVPASSSPHVVPAPWSNPAAIDPEEAFVASIASCHMLTYLHLARLAGFLIESYEDHAVGHMAPNEKKVPWVKSVTLNPRIVYGGDKRPSHAEEAHLHHEAHEQCFIAQSVKTAISVAGFDGE